MGIKEEDCMKNIITINRSFGSGGREVGKRLSEALSCAYYDKELLEKIAKDSGFDTGFIDLYDEKVVNNYVYSFGRSFASYQQSPSDKVQIIYTKVIQKIGEKGNAVIIGRCASHILGEQNPFKVFIYSSDMNSKIKRCFEKVPSDKEEKSEQQMAKGIIKIDKQRAKYHEFYTGQTWMDMTNYNLCIDTSVVGVTGAVELIIKALNELK